MFLLIAGCNNDPHGVTSQQTAFFILKYEFRASKTYTTRGMDNLQYLCRSVCTEVSRWADSLVTEVYQGLKYPDFHKSIPNWEYPEGHNPRRPRNTIRKLKRTIKCSARFKVFTAVTTKNGVFWDVRPCGSCKSRRFGGTYAFFIRVTRISELRTTLAVTSNRRTLRRLLVTASGSYKSHAA
jgi:hypothetical protein